MKKKPGKKSNPTEELSRRGAAGLAKGTYGRARTIPDKKTVYDRKIIKREDQGDRIDDRL